MESMVGFIDLPDEATDVRQSLIDEAVKLGKERMAAHPELASQGFSIAVKDEAGVVVCELFFKLRDGSPIPSADAPRTHH